MKDLKVIFMGTPSFCLPLLNALINNYNVIGIVTKPDHLVGTSVKYPPVKKVAIQNNIRLFQPEKINKKVNEIVSLKPDIIITCAYGQMIPKKLIEAPRFGCINVHASLLPKLRGGAPIHWAIIKGYQKTGITIMYMVETLDAGDIISQQETIISDEDNVGTLHDRLSIMAKDLLLDTLPDIMAGNVKPIKQKREEVTYARNIKREDEKIEFDHSKREVFNYIRGLNPWPGSYTVLEDKIIKLWSSRIGENGYSNHINGEIIKLYEDGIGVKVSDGEIIITELQIEGKKRMSAKDYLNGLQNKELLIGKIFR
jgi:methionyl-tRNA formyltransferase